MQGSRILGFLCEKFAHTAHETFPSSTLLISVLCFALTSAWTVDHVTSCLWCPNTQQLEHQNTTHWSSLQMKEKFHGQNERTFSQRRPRNLRALNLDSYNVSVHGDVYFLRLYQLFADLLAKKGTHWKRRIDHSNTYFCNFNKKHMANSVMTSYYYVCQ